MKLLRITYKLFALIYLAFIAVFVVFFYSLGSDKTSLTDKQKSYRKKWLKKVVNVIGLNVEVKGSGENTNSNKQSSLWVSNHISWMDIAVIGSQGAGFLSKVEIRKWPVIGWLGDKNGTVFIDRGGENASQVAAKAIAKKIIAGDNILVFPEATTTPGDYVKRFHARIFAPALDHQLLIQPIAIQYLNEQGRRHPKSIWNHDQSFMSNLMGVLAEANFEVVVTYLPIIEAKQFNERRQLADLAENQIRDIVLATNAIQIA